MQDDSPPVNHIHFTPKIYTMKQTTLLLTVVFLFSISSFGQLDKKTWLVGGSGTFNANSDNFQSTTVTSEYQVTEIKVTPNIGYFIVDKLALGVKSSFFWRKDKGISSNAGNSKTLRFDYGPFVRYYFLTKEKPFNLLADLSYQFGNLKFISNDKGVRNNFSIMAGPVIYFNSSVGVELLLGYKIEKEKLTTSTNVPDYTDTKKGVQLSIGFQIHLEKL
jgi:hypothetical protein